MRILIKGGVWKNTEDEILKAAVMKYGKNQWARVASLLSRKSAKQCKARWYEWLDPSIKKTEWSKEEEEKLLHLAKLMPNQWRTIAPIVGRTAGQCMEHYEKLLDQAQEDYDAETADDPRRLRPGEIDPAPERKPARPDPIDMDEDEKEMLSEARARLANTKGKKAKRKLRERQLEEAKRLSMLQKRRELKAAGIESRLGGVKRKHIDYSKEIPFQKVPPAGFFDVAQENIEGKKIKLDPKTQGLEITKMEGRHRREELERQKEKDKQTLKNLYKDNAPLAIAKVAAEIDPANVRRRTSLNLPAPQVTDSELEDIVKLGQKGLMGPPEGVPSQATQGLIADYAYQKATPTPSRTPIQEDIIMQEARNLRVLREMTPLSGKELPELYEGTGFEGVNPRAAKLATPNVLIAATPGRGTVASTPASFLGPGQTPLRDEFGLNIPDHISDVTSISSKAGKKQFRSLIAEQLKSLPEPEYSYELAVPKVEDADDDENIEIVIDHPEDASDVQERERRRREREHELELSRRSTAIKMNLPRPIVNNTTKAGKAVLQMLAEPSLTKHKNVTDEMIAASRLINQEMIQLMLHDAHKYPMPVEKASKGTVAKIDPVVLDKIEDEYLAFAREEVALEARELTDAEVEAFSEAWVEAHKNLMFVPDNSELGGSYKIPADKKEVSLLVFPIIMYLISYFPRH